LIKAPFSCFHLFSDGQGSYWWNIFKKKTLKHSRGRLIELLWCEDIVLRGEMIKFLLLFFNCFKDFEAHNSPDWTIHPTYCNNVLVDNVTVLAPSDSPNTDGIDPDSCTNVLIQNCVVDCGFCDKYSLLPFSDPN